ncbi:MAG: late control protein [Pseudogulbenkiania sp.]|nr:late control protein [Pseudogulbenkiania sp.]
MRPIFRVLLDSPSAQKREDDLQAQFDQVKKAWSAEQDKQLAILAKVDIEIAAKQAAEAAGDLVAAESHRQAGLALMAQSNAMQSAAKAKYEPQYDDLKARQEKEAARGKTDITATLADRLISLRITDKAGLDSDELEISIDDRDGAVSLPARGAMLDVSLGYAETGLTRIGQYRVDEVESSGPPQMIVFRGRPANMSGQIKLPRRHSWEGVALEQVVKDIAARNKLKAVCKVKATVARADQMNESDLHFLTRLAAQYDGTATVKGGQILVLPRGGQAKSVSGKTLSTLVLYRKDIRSWSFKSSDRNAAGGAVVRHHDKKTGKTLSTLVPNPDNPDAPPRVVRHTAANKGAAGAAAKAASSRAARSEITLSITLAGRADVVAERKLRTVGIKDGVDHLWTVDSVTHDFSSGGWETSLELILNKKAASKKKGQKAGQKKQAKPLKRLAP